MPAYVLSPFIYLFYFLEIFWLGKHIIISFLHVYTYLGTFKSLLALVKLSLSTSCFQICFPNKFQHPKKMCNIAKLHNLIMYRALPYCIIHKSPKVNYFKKKVMCGIIYSKTLIYSNKVLFEEVFEVLFFPKGLASEEVLFFPKWKGFGLLYRNVNIMFLVLPI